MIKTVLNEVVLMAMKSVFNRFQFQYLVLLLAFSAVSQTTPYKAITLFSETMSDSNCYTSGGRTRYSVNKDTRKNGNVLHLQLDDRAYSKVEIAMDPGKTFDLSTSRASAFIRFKIKGLIGKEQCFIGLLDNGIMRKNKVEVKYKSSDFFEIKSEWQEVICPIKDFGDYGDRWIVKDSVSEYGKIDWSSIIAVGFSASKEQNMGFSTDRMTSIFIDNLELVVSENITPLPRKSIPWKFLEDSTIGPQITPDRSNAFHSWFDTSLPNFTSVYTYGDPTDFKIIPQKDNDHRAVFATYQNDNEWSGVTIYSNKEHAIDITPYFETGGIEFSVKGNKGGEQFFIGIIDDESDGVDRKVQSRLNSRIFTKTTQEWQTIQIPFSTFEPIGRWWHTDAHYEVVGSIDWSKISEIRFSVDKYANKSLLESPDDPVKIYFSSIRFLKKINQISNTQHWKTFSSSVPDKLIDNFEDTTLIKNWDTSVDSTSKMKLAVAENPNDHSNSVKMDYNIKNWGSACYPFPENDTLKRNWTNHNSLAFDFYSSEKKQTGMIMIMDSGNEAWSAHFEAIAGWQEICIPFSRFKQFEWWQPDNAIPNGKMDLSSVNSFDWRPGTSGKDGTIIIDNLTLKNVTPLLIQNSNHIRINQVGYSSNQFKRFTVSDSGARNFIITSNNSDITFTGKLSNGTFWKSSGEFIKNGEFSGISKVGNYLLSIVETGETTGVTINNDLYRPILNDAFRAYYYQRASIDLTESHAKQFKRIAGHPDTSCSLHVSTNKSGSIDVRGGWYDAGDYGKYIVNAGITCGTLLGLYELYPQLIGDTMNIPESNNGISDLLDEIRYEIEWMIRMQDNDGGVFFKVGPLKWDEFVLPNKSTLPRYVMGKSTTATLNFTAVLAMAGRIYKKIDKEFSKDCIKRATDAWLWAIENPSITEPSEIGGTGAYSDSRFNDEFFWAACELYTTTKKLSYKKHILNFGKNTEMTTAADWQNTGNLGWFTLAINFSDDSFLPFKQASIAIRTLSDKFLKTSDSIPYHLPSEQFIWGSNSIMLNHAIVNCYAYKLTGMRKYLVSVVDIVDYIFGNNATGYSYVTGYGNNSPMQPHHRVMASDGIDEPIPGFLVGGPNVYREDEMSSEHGVMYPFKEPARAYVDEVKAYASNETCINWNAALVFVLGFLNENM